MMQGVIALTASVLPVALQSYRKETLPDLAQAMLAAILVPAPVVVAAPLPSRKNIIAAITGRHRTTRRTAHRIITARAHSSIARGHGAMTTIHTPRRAEEHLLLLTRRLPAAAIAVERVQAQTEEPAAETKDLNYFHV